MSTKAVWLWESAIAPAESQPAKVCEVLSLLASLPWLNTVHGSLSMCDPIPTPGPLLSGCSLFFHPGSLYPTPQNMSWSLLPYLAPTQHLVPVIFVIF